MKAVIGFLIMFSPAMSFYFADDKFEYSLVICHAMAVIAMMMNTSSRISNEMKA